MSMRNFNSTNVAKNGLTPGKERAMVATGEGNRHVYLGTFFAFISTSTKMLFTVIFIFLIDLQG